MPGNFGPHHGNVKTTKRKLTKEELVFFLEKFVAIFKNRKMVMVVDFNLRHFGNFFATFRTTNCQ